MAQKVGVGGQEKLRKFALSTCEEPLALDLMEVSVAPKTLFASGLVFNV